MKCASSVMQLYAVTDRMWLHGKSLAEQVEAALKGGVTCVQLREKELSPEAFYEEALEIKALCRRYRVPFFINDDVELAVKCDADGIHVGQSDMAAGNVRAMIGEGKILGVSVQTVAQALEAVANGADYLGVGAVFSTATKKDADDVSLETLTEICKAVSIPVVAIGGINKANLEMLAGTGVDGVALISAIFGSKDIEAECRELLGMSMRMTATGRSGLQGISLKQTQSEHHPRFRGAIFDLDGTLLDSMHVWETIGSDYLISRGITPEPNLNQIFKKMSIVQAAEYYQEHYEISDSIEDIIDGVNHMIENIYANDLFCKPGIKEMLERMQAQGLKMCVATATDRYMVEAALKNNEIEAFFCDILTCTEVGFGKDTPEIFEKALTVLGTNKENTAVFEDSLHAIETAKAAGFYVVGIEDRFSNSESAQIKELCDDYITSYQDWSDRNL